VPKVVRLVESIRLSAIYNNGISRLNAKSFTLTVKIKSKAKTTEGENLMASQAECVDSGELSPPDVPTT
jgi:phenylalanyl-tRNA synthetase beta subunit